MGAPRTRTPARIVCPRTTASITHTRMVCTANVARRAGQPKSKTKQSITTSKMLSKRSPPKCRRGLANLAEEAIPRANRGGTVLCAARGDSEVHLSVSVEDLSRASSLTRLPRGLVEIWLLPEWMLEKVHELAPQHCRPGRPAIDNRLIRHDANNQEARRLVAFDARNRNLRP